MNGSYVAPPTARASDPQPPRLGGGQPRYWVNAVLFGATVVSVFFAGAMQVAGDGAGWSWRMLLGGWVFALPLLAILLAHEFGHYIAARIHKVPASLPYFIPMPISPFGTMGAVIAMKGRIASRRALLDIGASGPLAGMAVALPTLLWGLAHSEVRVVSGHGIQEGQCLLYAVLKRLVVGSIPAGSDVFLHPVAFAGWTGLFITMINLLPVGQLDGGHIAYALWGTAQNRVARVVHWALLLLFGLNVGLNALAMRRAGVIDITLGQMLDNTLFWLVWFVLLLILGRVSGRDHPPTESGSLGAVRKVIAVGSLLLFVLLFMPTPMAAY